MLLEAAVTSSFATMQNDAFASASTSGSKGRGSRLKVHVIAWLPGAIDISRSQALQDRHIIGHCELAPCFRLLHLSLLVATVSTAGCVGSDFDFL